MFRKIVSQLSLSPSAVSQLTFYSRRLKQERITRTFSALAAVLLVGLQFAVIAAPPTSANAASPNDIIQGGFISKNDLLNRYDASAELKSLYARFGISRVDIQNSTHGSINSKDKTLKSIGRTQHAASDIEINVGTHTYWMRSLSVWDTGSNVANGSNYEVLEGKRAKDGSYFAVVLHCGNIVSRTVPPVPTPTPTPTPQPTPKPTPVPTPKPTSAPTPKPTSPPTPALTPTAISLACVSLTASPLTGQRPLKVDFTAAGDSTGQTISEYIFDFGDTATLAQASPLASHTYTQAGNFTATVRVKGSAGKTTAVIPACSVTVSSASVPPAFTKAKSALNLTSNIDATTKPAAAGDLIKYHLTTKNIGGTAGAYVVVEHVEDILEYADIVDSSGGAVSDGAITWPSQTIQPGTVLAINFTVKIKNPIPSTPVGSSDKNSFDLRIDNVYGNAVQINLTPPISKQVESAATSLPATGAPLSTMIVLLVCAFSLFFYFRNRQLLAEVKLLRGEYQGGL